jgi:FkbM family methyltransferase
MKKLPIDFVSSRNKNYFLFKQDIGLTSAIRENKMWEPHIYESIKNVNLENTNIIDIGANLGVHTLEFAEMVGQGEVYAFEPQRIVYYQLCGNIIANGFDNIIAYNVALSNKNGITLVENQNFYSEGLLNIGDTHVGKTGDEVEERTLDSYHFDNVSLIKIDVQGYEPFVLEGARETIKRNNPIILIEIEDSQLTLFEKSIDDIINFFKSISYNLNKIEGIDYIATPNNNKILVMSCCYNEERIIPFYLDYYTNFIRVDKIVVYDGGSTDKSQELLKEYPNVELIIDPQDKLDDRYLNDVRNNGWKKYRNDFDWIIVCDMDEFVYHPNLKEKLKEYDKEGITVPLTEGYDMINKKYPKFQKGTFIHNIVKRGAPDNVFLNKKSIFKSSVEINYHIGCHGIEPSGPVKYSPNIEIKHLHYKWLSNKYLQKRSAGVADRLSDWNLSGGCGSHNRPLSLTKVEEFNNRYNNHTVQVFEGENDIPIYAFSHNYLINNWEEIVDEQLDLLKKSGLYEELTSLFLFAYGDDNNFEKLNNKINKYDELLRINVIRIENNFYEYPTIQYLHDFVKNEKCYILYYHTKGVWSINGKGNPEAIRSWRKCLEYFNIEKWEDCINKLKEGYEVVGALYNYNEKEPLFSGNMWWATSDYLNKLPRLEYDKENDPYINHADNDGTWCRVECEKWINKIPNKYYNFYTAKDYGFYFVPIDEIDYRYYSNYTHIYEKIDGWFDFDEVYTEMVNKFPTGSHFVEIGAWLGKSTSYMAVEIANSHKNIKFDVIDTWEGSKNFVDEDYYKTDRDPYDIFMDNVSSVKRFINPIRGRSDEVYKNYEDKSLDFVFIDAGHDYQSVITDIKNWYPKVKDNGIIAGHDYIGYTDVKKAVDEFFGENKIRLHLVHAGTWIYDKENHNIIKYVSGGLLGDLIHQLSIIKENYLSTGKKGLLYLIDKLEDEKCWNSSVEETYNDIKDLILRQDYIYDCKIYNNEEYDIDLSSWRKSPLLFKSSFYEIFKKEYNVDWGKHKWLDLPFDNKYEDKIIISMSNKRYNSSFDFNILKKFNKEIIFATTNIDEYENFQKLSNCNFNLILFNNLLDYWTAINSCYLFVSNLSSFASVALASSKKNTIVLFPDDTMDDMHHRGLPVAWYKNDNDKSKYYDRLIGNRIALVCIAKDEDYYLDEWLEYNNKLGFDHIFLYENNWKCKIEKPYLTKIEFNGDDKQVPSYNHFIQNYKNDYDYVAFFDCDEFLVLKKHKDIHDFIKEFGGRNIAINWHHYGSNGKLKRENNSLLKQFTKRQSETNMHIKTILYLKIDSVMQLPHCPNTPTYDTNGKMITGSFNPGGPSDVAILNHYQDKTREDYEIKTKRGYADAVWREIRVEEWDERTNLYNDVEDLTALNFMYGIKISIIIPTYNRNELLKECLNSVLNQNYDNMEILVCHDGEWIEQPQIVDNRIQYLHTDSWIKDLGATQRNYCLQRITGNYVLFLDDDNVLYPNYINKMVSEINDNTGMIVCRIHFNDKEWNNYILPLKDELRPCFIDHLSILFRSDIAKSLTWDSNWGQDHRYITASENLTKEKGLDVKYIKDVLANHRFLGQIAPRIVVIHHCYLRYNWRKILEEQIFLMKKYGLYESCTEILTTIYADDKNNCKEFRDIIQKEDNLKKWTIIELEENDNEFETLKLLKKYCSDKNAYICYFHLKGVISEQIEPNIGIPTWRKYLNYFTINKWRENIEHLKDNDVVCVDWNFNDMHQKFVLGGHFFWTKSEYVRTLPDVISDNNRFLSEVWITSNPDVRVHENFNYEKIGYKNLYLQYFDPKNYRNDLENLEEENKWNADKESKTVYIITSHPSYNMSEEITKKTLSNIKSFGEKIILSSHCPVSQDIQNIVDYFVYDKNNPIIKHDFYTQSWFNTDDYYALLNITKYDNNTNHALGVFLNYYNSLILAKSQGFNIAVCTNFDMVFSEVDKKIIDNRIQKMISTNKKAYFMNTPEREGTHYKTIFFITNVDYFLKEFRYIINEQQYNEEIRKVGSNTNCLENFVYHALKNKTDDLLLEEINEENLFPTSDINLFSLIEYNTILPIENDPDHFIIWFSSSNSLDSRSVNITVRKNNNIILNEIQSIDKRFIWYKKVRFNKGDCFEISFAVKSESEILKYKKIEVNDDVFKDIRSYGSFQEKKKIDSI